MNSLVKTVPYTKVYKQKEHGILLYIARGITSPFILIAWLVYFKEKLDKHKFQINVLQEENNRKNYLLDKKENANREYKRQQEEYIKQQQSTTMEHNKKAVITGNRAILEEIKTYDGDISNINNWLGGF